MAIFDRDTYRLAPRLATFMGILVIVFVVLLARFGSVETWWLESAAIFMEVPKVQGVNPSSSAVPAIPAIPAIPVEAWEAKTHTDALKQLDWTSWYNRLSESDETQKEAFDALEPWHYVQLNYALSTVVITVRHDFINSMYLAYDGKAYYQVAGNSLWFNEYMLSPKASALFSKAAPPELNVHHEGPKGKLNIKLKPIQVDWFYFNARNLGQRYIVDNSGDDVTEASSESLILQSSGNPMPKVTLLEADALRLDSLDSSCQVSIEAFSFDQDAKSLGFIPYEAASGHITPIMRPGITRYRVKIIKSPSASKVGEGYGLSVYDFLVSIDLNPTVKGYRGVQSAGGLLTVYVDNVPAGATPVLQQNLVPRVKWHLISNNPRRFVALLPLTYDTAKGDYPYKVTLSFSGGLKSTWIHKGIFTVGSKTFKLQKLQVDKQVEASTRTNAAYEEYNRLFIPVRNNSSPKQLWEGPFIAPISGRLTTEWGMRRSVNGAATTYRHNGVDLAAPEGTPVKSTNSGKVVFVRNLILTGNTVIVDHGLGLFSVYLHLSKANVREGEMVKKGQVIAAVGSTGFSTGPHLHFTLSHHRIAMDPIALYEWDGLLE